MISGSSDWITRRLHPDLFMFVYSKLSKMYAIIKGDQDLLLATQVNNWIRNIDFIS